MFTLIRSSIFFVLMVLTTVFIGLTMSIFGWIIPFSATSSLANLWGKTNLFWLKLTCNLDYKITGLENIPNDQACIIMSKHQSAWETIAFRGIFPAGQAWVLKRELMYVPVFGWALAVVKPIAINRGSGRQALKQVVQQGIERLKQGRKIIIFPEGTRVAPGEKKKFGIGGAMLAAKAADYPVIPVAHNAGVFWRRRDLKKYSGTIEVIIGEPISVKGMDAGQINEMVENWIESQMVLLPSETPTY